MTTLSGNRIAPRLISNRTGSNSIDLDILLDKNCTINNNGTLTVNGLVSGTKGFSINGTGTTELKNGNTYTGQTILNGGTLKIGGTGTLGGGDYGGFMVVNGTFDYSSSADQIIRGGMDNLRYAAPDIFNSNSKIVMNGSGRLHFRSEPTFNQALMYTGGSSALFYGALEVNSGYVRSGNNADTEFGLNTNTLTQINIASGGTFEYNVPNSVVHPLPQTIKNTTNAAIDGTGNFILMNGWLTASGKSTFSGTVTIDSTGTLELTRKLPATVVNNGKLLLSPSTKGNWNGLDFNLSKTINGSTTTYTNNTDYVLATGTGEGNVTAQLQAAGLGNDASEFSGFVAGRVALVQRGVATFQTKVTNAINAGASAVIIYNNTTGLVAPSVTSSIPVFFITQTLGEQLVADMAGDTVSVNVDTGYEAGDLILPDLFGDLIGTGALVKGGSGTTLIANATPGLLHTGTTNVENGVLRVASSDAFPNSSGFVVTNGTALELTSGIAHSKNITIGGTGISSGGVVRNLSGDNTISGNVVQTSASRINSDAGTLTIDSGTFTGAFSVAFGGAGNVAIANPIATGTATITKDGAGTLSITAAATTTGTTTISAGTLKLVDAGNLTGGIDNKANLVLENNDGAIIVSPISGTGAVVKNGAGRRVALTSSSNSYTGATTVNEGTLAVGNGGTTGAITSTSGVLVNGGATLELNRSDALAFSRNVSGAGSVLKLGAGTTTVTSNLTHTGGTTIGGGTLSIGGGSTAGSISGDIVNNATLSFNRSDAQTFAGVISGTGNVSKTLTTASTTLSGNNSYSGTTTIGAGSLTAAHANAFGTSAVTVTTALSNQGSAGFTGGITVANNFTLSVANSAGTLRNISGNNILNGTVALTTAARINSDLNLLTLNGNISGAFAITFGGVGDTTVAGSLTNVTNLTKDGAGTLVLSAANTYTGTTTVSAGTLKLTGVGTVGAGGITNNANLVFENNDGATISQAIGGTNSASTITKNLSGKVILTGTLDAPCTTTVNAGTLAFGSGGTTGGVSGSGTFVVNSGATLEINRSNASTFPRAVSGAGAIVVTGGGTATFSAALTHTGGTTISAGTMSIGSNGTTGSITGDIVNNATVQFNRSDAYTYSGVISGTGNLVKAGSGTTTLSGNNSYSGTTTVSAGALRMGSANAISTSSVSVTANAVFEVTGGLTVANAFTLNGSGIGAAGALRSLSDSNVINGALTIGSAASVGSDVGLLTLNGDVALLTLNGIVVGAFGLTVVGAGNTVINGTLTTVTTLTKSGAGTLELTAVNTYTSTTTISAGTLKLTGVGTVGAGAITNNATLVVENNDNTTIARAISGTGAVTKNLNTKVIFTGTLSHTGITTVNAGTFAVGAGSTIGDVSGTTGNFVINSGSTLEINRSNASQFSRALSGEGSLVVLGGGTATFNGALTHTGGTTVSAGTMSIGAGSTIGSITGDIVNNAAVQFSRSDAYTYAGIISGTGNLVKAAAGTTTLTGNNSYSGTTTISGGSLRIGHANALGSGTSTVSTPANTALELIGGISLSRNLSSASTGISSGGSLRNISGNNTLDGNYTQTNTSRINSDADTLTLSNLGTLSGTFGLTLGGAGNINVQRTIATSTGALTKDGTGTVVLSAANTYTGVTTISGGTLRFALASSLYNNTAANWIKTKIVVNTGAVFALNVGGASEFTDANVTTLLTNLLTTINNNGLRSGSAVGFDTTNSASDFTVSGNITDSTGTGAGAVGVVKLGTGTLVLSGSNTYTGGTVIKGGTLKAGNSTCFGTGTITLEAGATLDKAGLTITNTIVNNGGTVID